MGEGKAAPLTKCVPVTACSLALSASVLHSKSINLPQYARAGFRATFAPLGPLEGPRRGLLPTGSWGTPVGGLRGRWPSARRRPGQSPAGDARSGRGEKERRENARDWSLPGAVVETGSWSCDARKGGRKTHAEERGCTTAIPRHLCCGQSARTASRV